MSDPGLRSVTEPSLLGKCAAQFSALLIWPNFVFNFVPIEERAVTITMLTSPAIKAYSMAVAPLWSYRNALKGLIMTYAASASRRPLGQSVGRNR